MNAPEGTTCHFCDLEIGDDEAIEAKTRNAWAHFTCWYDGGPFERDCRAATKTEGEPDALETCREWLATDEGYNHCGQPAEFILWGKLIPPEGLGPRCYKHAACHVGDGALSRGPGGLSNRAIFDLRTIDAINESMVAAQERAEQAEADRDRERAEADSITMAAQESVQRVAQHATGLQAERDQLASQVKEARELVERTLDCLSGGFTVPAVAILIDDSKRFLSETEPKP